MVKFQRDNAERDSNHIKYYNAITSRFALTLASFSVLSSVRLSSDVVSAVATHTNPYVIHLFALEDGFDLYSNLIYIRIHNFVKNNT